MSLSHLFSFHCQLVFSKDTFFYCVCVDLLAHSLSVSLSFIISETLWLMCGFCIDLLVSRPSCWCWGHLTIFKIIVVFAIIWEFQDCGVGFKFVLLVLEPL